MLMILPTTSGQLLRMALFAGCALLTASCNTGAADARGYRSRP